MTSKASKPSKKRVAEKRRLLHEQSHVVDIHSLKPHPENPNVGDIDEIAKSLNEFGQVAPLIVNARNQIIVGGHHTWLAGLKLGWKEMSVVEIDVDETEHKRIMVALNRLSDLRQTDERLLDQILQGLKPVELAGMGFTELDAEDLHTRVEELLAEATAGLDDLEADRVRSEFQIRKSKTFDGSPLGEEPTFPEDFDDEEASLDETEDAVPKRKRDKDALTDAEEDMNGGLVQFKPPEDLTFPGSGELEIPKLLTGEDNLMTFAEIPDNLLAWAGSATKDWPDDEQWWLYNWGIDSTSGMKDISKVIVSFYCFDDYFDNWWWYPERYAGKLVNSRIKYIVTPDWSMETHQARAFSIWQLYRSRWMARYLQEVGFKVCPNVSWKDGDETFLKKYVLATLPKKLPLISMQMQTVDLENIEGGIATFRKHLQLVMDTLEPEGLLLYVGKQSDELLKGVKIKCPVRKITNRMEKLSEQAKKRQKKKTI